MNTDDAQGAPGSVFLARRPRSKQQSEWRYNLRQLTRSQSQDRGSVVQKAGGWAKGGVAWLPLQQIRVKFRVVVSTQVLAKRKSPYHGALTLLITPASTSPFWAARP